MAIFTQPVPDSTALSPRETITNFLQRNAGLILGAGLFVTFWMLVYTFAVFKPGYAAKSVVIIKDSAITDRYVEPDHYYALQTTSSNSSNPVLNTMGILKSKPISDALWHYFQEKHPEQLKKNHITTQKEWESFFQDGSAFIKAKNQPGTDLISVQLSWSDPVIAQEALSVVLTAFQNASRDLNRSEQLTRTLFLNKQVVEIENQLSAIRKEKSAYQSEQRTVSMKRESEDLAGSRMELSNKLSVLDAQARGKENLSRRYQQLLGLNPEKALRASALGQNSSMSRLQDELYRLQQQYSLLSASLTDSNPKVREVQSQIEQVKANILSEQMRTLGSESSGGQTVVADSARNDLIKAMLIAHGEAQDLRAQATVMRTRLAQINTEISGFPEKEEGLANILQKEASLSLAVDHLRQKVLEGRIKEEQTLSNVFIVDPPHLPEKAQFPNRSHLFVLSLLMGLGVGLTVAMAKEQLSGNASYQLPNWMDPLDPPAPPSPPLVATSAIQKPVTTQRIHTPIVQEFSGQSTTEPVAERVELPAVGSLFDSLLPVSGPIRHQATAPTPEIRRDLTQPLPKEPTPSANASEPLTTQPSHSQSAYHHPLYDSPLNDAPEILQPDFEIEEAHLLPPAPLKAVRSIKLAPTPNPVSVAQAQAEHEQKTTIPMADLDGVPVMHAAPALTPTPDALTETTGYSSATPYSVANEPIRYKGPAQINVVAESPVSKAPQLDVDAAILSRELPETIAVEQLIADSDSATLLYEEKTRSMPLPRKMRGVPSFLLDRQNTAANQPEQPYTLIPKKQILTADDDLFQTVAPLSAPEHVVAPEALAEIPTAPFPTELQAESFEPHKPLIAPLWLGKNPNQRPESFFGLGNRKQKKQADMPTSITRLMASIQGRSGQYDD